MLPYRGPPGRNVKYESFLFDFNENSIFSTDFEKSPNIICYENLPSGTRVVPCGRRDSLANRQTDRQTDMTNLIVAFLNFVNASKNSWESVAVHCYGIAVTSLIFYCDVVSHIKVSTSVRKCSRANI